MSSNSLRYNNEILAWEYDQRNPTTEPGEAEWYLKYAKEMAKPVLELACGSGRLMLPLLSAGIDIDGVDNSSTMLERLGQRLTEQLRSRVRLYTTEVLEFTPDRTYGVVILGYNSAQYLGTKEQIQQAFLRVSQWLLPDGYFLLMVSRFNASRFANGKRVVIDWLDKPVVDEKTGLAVGSRTVSYLDIFGEMLVKESIYHIKRPGLPVEIINENTALPIIKIDEYLGMLNKAGFRTKLFGGYDESLDNGQSKRVCIVAKKS